MTSIQPEAAANALLVKLDARPDFASVASMPRGAERKAAAYNALVATAQESQKPFVALAEQLKSQGAIKGYELLVSPNMLVVTPTSTTTSREVLAKFQAMEGVKAIYSNSTGGRIQGIDVPTLAPGEQPWGLDVEEPAIAVAPPTERPYGVDQIGAPEAWAKGADGAGLVYGSIDTGADVSHEAIANDYRGRAADGSLSHDYNWFDPTGAAKAPVDNNGHGTHTIGTVTGEGVGVAPKAKYISAAGLTGQVDSTLKSLQWMLAPTKIDGSAPDPTKAPDVVGMSWWTGPNNEDLFLESLQDLRAAGIVPVKSAGNKGPGPKSISSPGQFPEVIATAAVDANGNVARFSSRGPAPYPNGSLTPKPDYAAPGVDVVSSIPGNKYGKMSGTSMAQPHMSAAVLAILSKYPSLTDAQLDAVLTAGAIDKGAPGRDDEYGIGLINLPASLDAAAKLLAGQQAAATPAA
jgi:hypothetical protein